MKRRWVLGFAIALCVIGVVVLGYALVGGFPAPGEKGEAHLGLVGIGLAIAAVGGLLIGYVTFRVQR